MKQEAVVRDCREARDMPTVYDGRDCVGSNRTLIPSGANERQASEISRRFRDSQGHE